MGRAFNVSGGNLLNPVSKSTGPAESREEQGLPEYLNLRSHLVFRNTQTLHLETIIPAEFETPHSIPFPSRPHYTKPYEILKRLLIQGQ